MTFLCVENPTAQLGGSAGLVDHGGLVAGRIFVASTSRAYESNVWLGT